MKIIYTKISQVISLLIAQIIGYLKISCRSQHTFGKRPEGECFRHFIIQSFITAQYCCLKHENNHRQMGMAVFQ